ncbi:MAG: S24 family peptidase [Candidatus Binataceae bacterium]
MAKMARLLGFSHASGYQRYELEDSYRRHKFVKPDIVHKLAKSCVGKGHPPITEEEIYALGGLQEYRSGKSAAPAPSPVVADTVRIAEIDIRAGMGGGGLVEVVNHVDAAGQSVSRDAVKNIWSVPKQYLHELGLPEQGLYLFRAVGDSMTRPDGGGINSGDILLADTKDKHPSPPGIFALDDGFGVVVKRLEFIAYSDPPRISIRSDNPAHASYELPAEEVRVIGRCVWYGRRL